MNLVERIKAIRQLYSRMPGAPPVPNEDGIEMWGEVENSEHWLFCERIIDLIRNTH